MDIDLVTYKDFICSEIHNLRRNVNVKAFIKKSDISVSSRASNTLFG